MNRLDSRRAFLKVTSCASALAAWPLPAQADDPTGGDPLNSMQWPNVAKKFMGKDRFAFSSAVRVQVPQYAEDAMNVPVLIDARELVASAGRIEKIVLVADRNPLQHILTFEPMRSLPVLAFRFRLEQGSPVRALCKTENGQWHVGAAWINAAGGGCTVPGATRADGSWSKTLNQVQARLFRDVIAGSHRLRVRVMHPMDTGLVNGIPAFHLETLELRDAADQAWWKIALHEPVSENPLLTFEFGRNTPQQPMLVGHDNNGNRIRESLSL
jgi:sulfur-oxidizing protein SoxY